MHDAPSPAVLPPLIDAQDVAEQTRLSLPRVYELVRSGKMPAIKFGKSVRFDPEVLAQWLRDGGTAS